jgi:prepilin-type N-terminal cleavage/methylation domain-containing protein
VNNLRSDAGGFSLVEVIIAIVVISFGLLALATTTGYVSGQLNTSRLRTERSAAVQQAIEDLYATPFGTLANGSRQYGRYSVSWQLQSINYALTRIELVSVGPGHSGGGTIAPSVPDTVRFSLVRP